MPGGTLLFLICTAVVLGSWLVRLSLRSSTSEPDSNWLIQFSVDRYRVMLKLFDDADYQWILRQPSGSQEICDKLRAARRRAFRAYLKELKRDFHRLQIAAKYIILESPENESQLMRFLFRQEMKFDAQVWGLQLYLLLDSFRLRRIDPRGVFDLAESTHARLFWLAAETMQPQSNS